MCHLRSQIMLNRARGIICEQSGMGHYLRAQMPHYLRTPCTAYRKPQFQRDGSKYKCVCTICCAFFKQQIQRDASKYIRMRNIFCSLYTASRKTPTEGRPWETPHFPSSIDVASRSFCCHVNAWRSVAMAPIWKGHLRFSAGAVCGAIVISRPSERPRCDHSARRANRRRKRLRKPSARPRISALKLARSHSAPFQIGAIAQARRTLMRPDLSQWRS